MTSLSDNTPMTLEFSEAEAAAAQKALEAYNAADDDGRGFVDALKAKVRPDVSLTFTPNEATMLYAIIRIYLDNYGHQIQRQQREALRWIRLRMKPVCEQVLASLPQSR